MKLGDQVTLQRGASQRVKTVPFEQLEEEAPVWTEFRDVNVCLDRC